MNSTDVTASTQLPAVSTESLLVEDSDNRGAPTFDLDPVTQETVDVVTDVLSCHALPVISACGIVGNVLTLVVLLMQKRG